MIHYDFKAIMSKVSIVVVALLSLTIGGVMTSHTYVSAHSVKRVRPYQNHKKTQHRHTQGVSVKRTGRNSKNKSRMTKRQQRNNRTQNSQRPMKIEHRYTSKDPISIGPKNSKKK
ncbi:hypothetical protein [Acetilactobacillus jinshanensis]|uniref:Uncharacterized protein n=1 Tax=Acetilactobacillus jinshanensis TaxID=1720083 RepID=A0A4P6ZIZ8_9LACO|nr:hypothetical protein [Acetilactobacillus jinshanensis]QBP17681.1 hypothetical protein ELX58_00445 [Acetilactobacillus jinshanensis]URL61775.1 hypothetical protein HGK75_07505 [uncultured bacterium]